MLLRSRLLIREHITNLQGASTMAASPQGPRDHQAPWKAEHELMMQLAAGLYTHACQG